MKIISFFNLKNKKIIFESSRKNADDFPNYPEPAYQNLPVWYKLQKLFSNNENNFMTASKKSFKEQSTFHSTYKMCVPLVDSMTAGYFIKTSADISIINVSDDGYTPSIGWQVSWQIMDSQENEVLGNYPIPNGFYKKIFRWELDHRIITPKGYSLWITHPSHRYDLPFLTLSGFVDTDKHPNKLFLPFFLQEGFEGIIPAGTPIAQIIPIKRDTWISEKKPVNSNFDEQKQKDSVKINISRVYKNNFWSKKKYQ